MFWELLKFQSREYLYECNETIQYLITTVQCFDVDLEINSPFKVHQSCAIIRPFEELIRVIAVILAFN
jgi:hypothetical protein